MYAILLFREMCDLDVVRAIVGVALLFRFRAFHRAAPTMNQHTRAHLLPWERERGAAAARAGRENLEGSSILRFDWQPCLLHVTVYPAPRSPLS